MIKQSQLSISGIPEPQSYIGFGYQFKPNITKLNEADTVSFTIENKPEWLIFDNRTGEISGFPTENDIGFNANISIAVTDGEQTKALVPFSIEVKSWQGFGFCSGNTTKGELLCSPISNHYAVQAQCKSWTDGQGLLQPIIHVNERIDLLENEAKELCSNPVASGNTCPPGQIEVPQQFKEPAIACMDNLPIDELTKEAEEQMTNDLDKHLKDSEEEALPDLKPLEPQIIGPDEKGNYTVTLPPPVSQQNELEKQWRMEGFGESLNYLRDYSSFIEQGSYWNKAVCYSWNKSFGDNQTGVTLDAMAYMKLSGEAAASATITGSLLGMTKPLVNLFSKTQVYALPEEYVNGLNIADAEIKNAESGNPNQMLGNILKNSPTLKVGIAQVSQQLTEALQEANKAFKQAKAEAEAAIGKTKAEIAKAKAKFDEAKAQLDKAKAVYNEAKEKAETTLQSLHAQKSEIVGSLQM